jgi:hypothetical protein
MFLEGQEILEKRYKVMKKVGAGAFGEIYKGKICLWHILGFILPIFNNSLMSNNKCMIVEKKKTGEILAAKVVSWTTKRIY